MNKLLLLILCPLFIMCSTQNTTVRDDFKSASETEKKEILKNTNATSTNKSVLVLTQGYKGEKIIASQENKNIYSEYPITNLKKQLADYFSFDNTKTLLIYDNFSKQEVIIESKMAVKHKFIYLKKVYKEGKAKYFITYSNTLRPLK
jgi:hypothetical protein